MKKIVKRIAWVLIILAVVCVVFVLLLGAHFYARRCHIDAYLPENQRGTVWSTEDGAVLFSVPADGNSCVTGELKIKDQTIPIKLYFSIPGTEAGADYCRYDDDGNLVPLNEFETEEFWFIEKIKKDKFVVMVEKSDYFAKGTELVFYKTKG